MFFLVLQYPQIHPDLVQSVRSPGNKKKYDIIKQAIKLRSASNIAVLIFLASDLRTPPGAMSSDTLQLCGRLARALRQCATAREAMPLRGCADDELDDVRVS